MDITSSGSFQLARDTLTKKSKKARFPAMSPISQFRIPCSRVVEMYQTFIQPIALNNAEHLTSITKNKIEAIRINKSLWLPLIKKRPIALLTQINFPFSTFFTFLHKSIISAGRNFVYKVVNLKNRYVNIKIFLMRAFYKNLKKVEHPFFSCFETSTDILRKK